MSKTIAIVTGARRGAGRGIAIALERRGATVDVRAALSGKTVIGAELALQYGVTDEGGRQPSSDRDTHGVVPHVHHSLVIR